MLLDTLISDDQIPYEEALLQDGENETLWLEYAEAYSSDFEKARFILDRAVTELPASILLWNTYLQLPWGPNHRDTLIGLYERALRVLYTTPAFWFRYIDLLSRDSATNGTLGLKWALDMAMFSLDRSHHGQIWKKYLELAENLNNKDSAAIYARFHEISLDHLADGPLHLARDCILKVAQYGDCDLAIKLFKKTCHEDSQLTRLYFEFVLDFLRVLLASAHFQDDLFIEETTQNAGRDFPGLAKSYNLAVAAYYSKRLDFEKTRHFHHLAFISANSVDDVVEVFDIVTNWEEIQIEKLFQADKFDELRLRMKQLSRLIDKQELLINDVLLKRSPFCLDHWLERAQIFARNGDQREVITTYVTAIRRVNPLKSSSKNGLTMASLWTAYAEIYISQGDLSTANVIFSHAVALQFKTAAELAEIYIAWTEMIFTVSDEDALNHIELVLLIPEDAIVEKNENRKKSVHDEIPRNTHLWAFYIDILKSMIEEGEDNLEIYQKLGTAYKRLLSLKIISLRLLLDYAEFVAQQKGLEQSYAVYEAGIQSFSSPQAQYHIWVLYIDKFMQKSPNLEVAREFFGRCVSSGIPGFLATEIYTRYFELELSHGNIVRSVKIMRNAIAYLTDTFSLPRYTKENRNKIADDKFLLYKKTMQVLLQNLRDVNQYREVMAEALQDPHLPLPCTIELGLEFAQFEVSQKETHRARSLFRFLAGLGHPDTHVMKPLWKKWEAWEIENGTEDSFKQLLVTRRQVVNDMKDVADLKADINPMGFVVGEKSVAGSEPPLLEKNPDIIELDMDM
ncbi:pre-mRNA-splicing factor SYF1 [Metschnikowia aff. pulcherrima]|uniref:Pre-mRNA-splicing factor SYF1 n=1 Tax=Metschnikowia aff. pulcherrima TaxID=2163413 RepID=A0A4P6XLA7_9ASCO|nr:pre-mRNA-splicing factor SYF1 [Metschnikowia aff. pulcherrima]